MKPLVCLLVLAVSPAWAQALADPTRPPSASAAAGAPQAALPGPQLQSVLLSPGRKLAVISGEMVALGGKYGDATLVRLTESEAVLKAGGELQVLKLYPGVDKKPVRAKRAAAGGKKP